MLDILDKSLLLCSIGNGAEFIGSIFLSVRKILLMQHSMYEVRRKMWDC